MHKYKKNRGKFTFSAIFLVFGLRGVAVASRWASTLWYEVGALEGTTLPLYVRTKSVFGLCGVAVYRALAKLFFSFFPLSFSKLPRYHFDTNPLSSNTFPVLCYLSLGVHSPSIPRLYTLHATLYTLHPTRYTLHPTPFTFPLKNLHTCKFCCTFAPVISPRLGIMSFGWVVTRHNKGVKTRYALGISEPGKF